MTTRDIAAAEHERDGPRRPFFAEGFRQFGKDAPLLRAAGISARISVRRRSSAARSCEVEKSPGGSAALFANLVARQQQFHRLRGVQALALLCGLLDCLDHRPQLRGGIGECIDVLDDLVERGQLPFQLARLVEGREQFVRARDRLFAQFDGVGLLRRDAEMAVLFQRLFGRVPPALELRLGEDIPRERLRDLFLRGFAAEIGQNRRHEGDGILLRIGLHGVEIGGFAREDVPLRDRLERLRCVLQLHRVPLFRFEIDGDLVDEKVDRIDLAESPAFVEAIRAGFEGGERLARLRCDFSGVHCFLYLCFHRDDEHKRPLRTWPIKNQPV